LEGAGCAVLFAKFAAEGEDLGVGHGGEFGAADV
jgi:hypothetical protein